METERPENPLIAMGNLIGNLIAINLLTILCCLPVITAGPSFSALYYAMFGVVNGEGKAAKRFFKAFRRDMKQGIPVGLLLLALAAAAVGTWYFANAMEVLNGWLIALIILLAFWFAALSCWLFPLTARFENSFFETVRNGVLLSLMRFPVTLVLIIINFSIWALLLFRTDIFLRLLVVWLAGAFSLPAYFSTLILKKPLALDGKAYGEDDADH